MTALLLLFAAVAPPTPFPDIIKGEAPPAPVVRVFVMEKDGRSAGSGTLVTPNLILTCNHVVKDRSKEEIEVMFGNWDVVLGKVLKVDEKHDLALIELKENRLEPCPKIVGCKVGDILTIRGFGYGPFRSATGTYSERDKSGKWGVIDKAQARMGDSGGPVYLGDEMCGVLWGATEGQTWFTAGDEILAVFPELNTKPTIILQPKPYKF